MDNLIVTRCNKIWQKDFQVRRIEIVFLLIFINSFYESSAMKLAKSLETMVT